MDVVSEQPGRGDEPLGTTVGEPRESFSSPDESDHRPRLGLGSTVGRYVITRMLGRGGMGTVYEAFDPTLDRLVAVKLLHRDMPSVSADRLIREAKALAQLSHPNVVQVYEVDEQAGQAFVAMELVNGQTLRQWAKQKPRPSWRACVALYQQAGAGLAAAHERGLVHRDFKPSNAIVDPKGRVRVLDFGLARNVSNHGIDEYGSSPRLTSANTQRAWESTTGPLPSPAPSSTAMDARLTETGLIMGTPAYMPLEQMRGHEVDARGDQFSFCVALYEAIYGQRPFAGPSWGELMINVREEHMVPVPRGRKVPARLREVLRRGLAADPERRWESMEALLAQLRRLLAPRSHRAWLGLGVVVAGGLGLLGIGLSVQAEREQQHEVCSGALAQLGEAWSEDDRAAVRGALLGTELPHAPDTWSRVQRRLDGYARAWVDAHTQACRATAILHEQTEEEMSLRMECLRERKTALEAIVGVLAQSHDPPVDRAVALVTGLPRLERCGDVSLLRERRTRIPLPEQPAVAAEVERLRARLANIDAEEKAGRYARALEQLEPVLADAEATAHPPLLAEVKLQRGSLLSATARPEEAEHELMQAYEGAVAHGHDEVMLQAAKSLAFLVGYEQSRHAEGMLWYRIAKPLAQRSGDPMQRARLAGTLGAILESQGKSVEAEREFRRGLELLERELGPQDIRLTSALNSLGVVLTSQQRLREAEYQHMRSLNLRARALGPDHPDVAMSLANLGITLENQGKYERAWRAHRRALAIQVRRLGEDHPSVATSYEHLGVVLQKQGKHEDAERHYRRALRIRERAQGPDHADLAYSLGNLSNALIQQGRFEEAEALQRRAIDIRQRILGEDHPDIADGLSNLGVILSSRGEFEHAEHLHRRALEIKERALGPDHPSVATSLENLGGLLYEREAYEEAEPMFRRVLSIREQALGPEHPSLGTTSNNFGILLEALERFDEAEAFYRRSLAIREHALGAEHPGLYNSLMSLAILEFDQHRLDDARAHAERATSVIQHGQGFPPSMLADARFLLARTLWPDPASRPRARALAQQARETWTAAGPDSAEDLASVERWLASHRAARRSTTR